MFEIGTRVTVASVNHLGRFVRPVWLVGRTGTISGTNPDGLCIVDGLSRRAAWVFAADHLTPA